MCCCGSRMCMLCTCLILVVILIGLLFGFGVFKHGFHKVKDTFDACDPHHFNATFCGSRVTGRPFFAPPPLQ
ncbi:uncharacterized protein LOC116213020 [Punica granatum]|uniref:Transmembrane protein n=2 Tax=Punica granatum TaxID=22663 RepID=A0A218XKZ6_PUNGR|nr:uncharacterized protein LOC116213020 [Punica granatum]OWM85925.1 hypothetical protein CDL15_Pgr012175 [Punica granatum]PKI78825.1 hypothetical protein CRG98_000785 [Punica granatum]